MTDPAPTPDPSPETPPASTPETPPASPPPAPNPPDDNGDSTITDLREAVSSLADVVTGLVSEVRDTAGDSDAEPQSMPWHKKKWF